ncbi:MAG: thiol reductant ABC exporter subunit CydD [Actinomycetes bacterium]
MKPLDPRLLRYARSTRGFIVLAVVLGVLTAVLVIAQARLLSDAIVKVTAGGEGWDQVRTGVILVAVVFAARAAIAWLAEVAAVRASARAKAELREATLEQILALGPASDAAKDPGALATLVTRGVDALDGYYSRYLPQLILAVIVPLAILITILGQDILSTVIVAITIPLIPMFMILIGMYTQSRVDRQWKTLAVLSGHFLDLVSGLPTLKIFGRAKSQVAAIGAIGDRYRSTTMGVLRVSFLSSLALELLATLSVALVAVSIGLRLAQGQLSYSVGLFVLLLAPEAYLPLRLVGQHFHAAAEGLGAAERVFVILETPVPTGGTTPMPRGPVSVEVTDLQVTYPGRPDPALAGATFTARPGTVTAVVGSSGGGKSTLINALLCFIAPSAGQVRLVGAGGEAVSLSEVDVAAWRERVAWLPQRAHLVTIDLSEQPTIADVVRLGRPEATDEVVWSALADAGLDEEIRELPDGLATRLSADGSGLSVGQRQRLALARALATHADIVILDEPTAALDGATEAAVVTVIGRLAERGAVVIVVAHRPALMEIADQVIRLDRGVLDAVPGAPVSAVDTIRSAGW